MVNILFSNNHDLLREIEISKKHILVKSIPTELLPYKDWLLNYFDTLQNLAFYRPEENLCKSSHPVSWLRVKFLVQRAKVMGLVEEAERMNKDWQDLAKLLNINENYHKYYRDSYNSFIVTALDDMIKEANPIFFKDFDSPIVSYIANDHNFIQLVTWAWQTYIEAPTEFRRQEQHVLNFFETA
jgi:hypothetical protein